MQIEREIAPTDLQRELRPHEAEVVAQLDEKAAQLGQQALVQVGLGVAGLQAKEFQTR